MASHSVSRPGPSLAPPRTAAAAWLVAPLRSLGPEGDAQLRYSMTRRLEAVVASAILTSFVAAMAAYARPGAGTLTWLALDLALAAVRLPVVLRLMRVARAGGQRAAPPLVIDLFVACGTLWSALLGFGAFICFATNDPGLAIILALVAMGTNGAQSVRNPGTPRLNILQMCLIYLPLAAGLLVSSIPMIEWAAFLVPVLIYGMSSITLQLHQDHVDMMAAQIENRRLALHCPLTGIPNRASFAEALHAAFADGGSGRPITMLSLDLDGFKKVNDELGHPTGDKLLMDVAERLRGLDVPTLLTARLGGDEFAILLPSDDAMAAEHAARVTIASLSRPYRLEDWIAIEIGVSIGIATGAPLLDDPSGAEAARLIVLHADEALYAAKRAGRGDFRWRDDQRFATETPVTRSLRGAAHRMRECDAGAAARSGRPAADAQPSLRA